VPGCEGIPSVHIDNATAASDAMTHLYKLGHRRIGIVTGPLVSPLSRDRLAGATARAKTAKAERDMIVMNGDFSIESGALAGERLLGREQPPTAIFCFNDEMAMGVIETARRRALRVPNDLSVVGFDDIRYARTLDPPLTTVAQPMRQIGEGTVRMLLEIRRGSEAPESVTLPHTLWSARAPLRHAAADTVGPVMPASRYRGRRASTIENTDVRVDNQPAFPICAIAFFISLSLMSLTWVMTDHSLPKGSSNRALRSP
jgi:LacI family repressor for deo operon, udp, cdd, tsx, nupC, and nupG